MTGMEPTRVLVRNPRVEYRSMGEGEGGVLLHLDTAAYHGLNEVGSLIWRLLEEPTAFGVLMEQVREQVHTLPAGAEEEIAGFVTDLIARDLVLEEPATS